MICYQRKSSVIKRTIRASKYRTLKSLITRDVTRDINWTNITATKKWTKIDDRSYIVLVCG